jgi:hypothetical protein
MERLLSMSVLAFTSSENGFRSFGLDDLEEHIVSRFPSETAKCPQTVLFNQ